MKYIKTLLITLIMAAFLMTACAAGGESAPPDSGEIALTVTGNVANEQAWSEAEVRDMQTMEVESTNKDGETSTYTGILITSLVDEAGPGADASAVVFVADDGYTAEVTLEELNACADCIVSFRNQGGFSTVMPGFSGKLQVKGVIEIQVK